MSLLQRSDRPAAAPARFPENRVGYAVGDIHGRADLLSDMIDLLESRAGEEQRAGGPPILVFLGDYVDRGPDSSGVIQMLLQRRPSGYERHYLRGNHEQSMMAFLTDPVANKEWLLQGGAETLASYGVQPPPLVAAQDHELIGVAQLLMARLPDGHYDFLFGLQRYVVCGDYVFVHAGVDTRRTLEQQTDQALYWSRQGFIADRRAFSHRVVHGHTPVDQPYADHRRVAIDTGAYASGTLTAARFEGEAVTFHAVSRPRAGTRAAAEAIEW